MHYYSPLVSLVLTVLCIDVSSCSPHAAQTLCIELIIPVFVSVMSIFSWHGAFPLLAYPSVLSLLCCRAMK